MPRSPRALGRFESSAPLFQTKLRAPTRFQTSRTSENYVFRLTIPPHLGRLSPTQLSLGNSQRSDLYRKLVFDGKTLFLGVLTVTKRLGVPSLFQERGAER